LDAFNPSSRRPVFAALLAVLFTLGLAGAYAAGSSGNEEKPAKRVGVPAAPLDVPAAGGESGTLREAVPLPSLARKPPPPPPPPPRPAPKAAPKPVEPIPEEPVAPEPVIPEPVAPPTPPPPPPPEPAPPPPVEFDDEG
jgi:hypothetical protein